MNENLLLRINFKQCNVDISIPTREQGKCIQYAERHPHPILYIKQRLQKIQPSYRHPRSLHLHRKQSYTAKNSTSTLITYKLLQRMATLQQSRKEKPSPDATVLCYFQHYHDALLLLSRTDSSI